MGRVRPHFSVEDNVVYDYLSQTLTPGSHLLEVSCGVGKLLQRFKDAGFQVSGTNYSVHDEEPSTLDIHNGVDLYRGLPFADESCDCVLLMDVIEHLRDHDTALAELARVLRPGGRLVLVTPNLNRLSSRLHFLFTGFHKVKYEFIGFDVPVEAAFSFHNYCPHLPVLLYQLYSHRLVPTWVDTARVKAKSVLMYLVLAPFIYPLTYYNCLRAEGVLARSGAGGLLARAVSSFKSLCGESLLVVAEKTATPDLHHTATTLPLWHRVHAPRPAAA